MIHGRVCVVIREVSETLLMYSAQTCPWDPGGSAMAWHELFVVVEDLLSRRAARGQRFGRKGQNEFPGVCGGSRGCFLTRGMAWTVLDHETASCLADFDTSLSTCLQSAQAASREHLARRQGPGNGLP